MSKISCKIHPNYKGLEMPEHEKCLNCWKFYAFMMASKAEIFGKLREKIKADPSNNLIKDLQNWESLDLKPKLGDKLRGE